MKERNGGEMKKKKDMNSQIINLISYLLSLLEFTRFNSQTVQFVALPARLLAEELLIDLLTALLPRGNGSQVEL